MGIPERGQDYEIGRRVVHGLLTAGKLRHTDPATELPDQGMNGRIQFDRIVIHLVPLLTPLAREALSRRAKSGAIPNNTDVETLAELAAAIGVGRMSFCSCYYFSKAMGQSWIKELVDPKKKAYRPLVSDRPVGTGEKEEEGVTLTSIAEAPDERHPSIEPFYDRVESLRTILRLSRRVWIYAALTEAAVVPRKTWKGDLARVYLKAGGQNTLTPDFKHWNPVSEQLDEAVTRIIEEMSQESRSDSDDPVLGCLQNLLESLPSKEPRFPLEVELTLAVLKDRPNNWSSGTYPALAAALRHSLDVFRDGPDELIALAVVELASVAGEVATRDVCATFLAKADCAVSGPAYPLMPLAGCALEAVLRKLPEDHTEHDPAAVLTNIDRLRAASRSTAGQAVANTGLHAPVDENRILLEQRLLILLARIAPASPLFNVIQYLGLGQSARDLPVRLPSLHHGPPHIDRSTLVRSGVVIAGWAAEAIRRPVADCDDDEARLRLVAYEEIPSFLAVPTREGREVLDAAGERLAEWIDDSESVPKSWSDVQDDRVRLTILSALRVVLIEDLHAVVKQLYEAHRGYQARPNAPDFLHCILGPDPLESTTWPAPEEVERRLIEIARIAFDERSTARNWPGRIASI